MSAIYVPAGAHVQRRFMLALYTLPAIACCGRYVLVSLVESQRIGIKHITYMFYMASKSGYFLYK